MKELTFTVTVRFAHKIIDENDFREVAKNIVDALESQAANAGIAPYSFRYIHRINKRDSSLFK